MKHYWHAVVLLPVALGFSGCVTLDEPVRSTSWLKRLGGPTNDANCVQVDVALIERPLGDPYFTTGIWQHTDCQLEDLGRVALVERNGFRVGRIVGMTPRPLQELLKSERWCPEPRTRFVPSGHGVLQFLGPNLERAEFEVHRGDQSTRAAFDQARFALELCPTLTKDGRTTIKFTPKIQTGETMLPFQPDPDKSAWTLKVERPCKSYPDISWEVTLAPNEYLVIGVDIAKAKTFAAAALTQDDDTRPMQRLLVIRTGRSIQGTETGEPTLEDLARTSRSPSLAVQAGMSTVRASGN